MSFDFPNSPTNGQVYAPSGGPIYVYTGGVWRMQGSGQVVTAEARNRIVNPAMQISQELGDTGSPTSGAYVADQWMFIATGLPNTGSARVHFTAPDPLNAMIMTFNTPKPSLAAGDQGFLTQFIEGIRVADFGWGTAAAKQIVLTFSVRSQIAGTFAVAVRNANNTRSWIGTYTIAAGEVNAFQRRTMVISGDTTGTWPTGAVLGLYVSFVFAAGTTSNGVAGWQAGNLISLATTTNGAAAVNSFHIADVGLYLDPNATGVPPPWVMPDEAQELAACQRYWELTSARSLVWTGYVTASQAHGASLSWKANKRIAPAITFTDDIAPLGFSAAATVGAASQWGVEAERIAAGTSGYGYFLMHCTANARL